MNTPASINSAARSAQQLPAPAKQPSKSGTRTGTSAVARTERRSRPRTRHSPALRALSGDVRAWIMSHLFSVWFVATFAVCNMVVWIVAAMLGHGLPLTELTTSMGEFSLPKLLTTLLLARGVLQLMIDVVLLLVMFSLSEPLLGRVRMLLTGMVSALIGTLIGLSLCAGFAALMQGTPVIDRVRFVLSPLTLGVGMLMAASAFSRPLWRRRMRLIGYASIVAVLLFSGNPGTYCMLAAALTGHLIGSLMAKRDGTAVAHVDPMHWQLSTSFEARRMFAAFALVLALGPILAVTSPAHAGPLSSLGLLLSPVDPDTARLAARLAGTARHGCFFQFDLLRSSMPGAILRSLLPTAVMALMAWGLYRGRRLAAWVTAVCDLGATVIAVAYYLVMPLAFAPDGLVSLASHGAITACVVNAVLPAGFAVALLMSLRHFPIRTDARHVWRGLAAIVATLLACMAVYLGFGLSHPHDFRPTATPSDLLVELPGRFVPIGFLSHTRLRFMPVTFLSSVVYQGVGFVFWTMVLIVCARWMRDMLVDDERARRVADGLVEHGGESMSFMATWEGNRYWFSPTGRSAVAYRVINGIALTCTGPFGERGEWLTDLREFARFCATNSWTPAFYAVHREQRDALVDSGWYSLEVGGEMVVDPRAWKTTGKKWQDIRTAINKAKRDGIVDVLTTFDDAGSDVREQIEEISEQWAGEKALPEMKFTLGGVEELRDPRVRILYAVDADGLVLGVTSWLPTWRDGRIVGWTLDFMRHRTDSPNGIMEFLIARMAERLRDEGQADPDRAAEFMSLSAAPLAGMNPDRDNTDESGHTDTGTAMLQHALQIVADWMEPAYGFHSLFNFKRKFQPGEDPVYVCYPDPAMLPQLGLAVMRAYVPSVSAAEALAMIKTLQR
ncbi:bifunctional lysylphosphatidylglycerol flippase/synthetase MprF [Bifidobacterium aerophilum]